MASPELFVISELDCAFKLCTTVPLGSDYIVLVLDNWVDLCINDASIIVVSVILTRTRKNVKKSIFPKENYCLTSVMFF
jgi:hypothetical protein